MADIIARVAVENTAYCFDKEYDYLVPAELTDQALPGCRVTVYFGRGNNKRIGLITRLSSKTESDKLKPIEAVLDEAPLFNNEMLSMVSWMKERTFCTLFEAAKALLPTGINYKNAVFYFLSDSISLSECNSLQPEERQIVEFISSRKTPVKKDILLKAFGLPEYSEIPDQLVQRGVLSRMSDAIRKIGDMTEKMVRLVNPDFDIEGICLNYKLTNNQKSVINVLLEAGSASVKEICYFTGLTDSVVKTLERKGLVELFENPVLRKPYYSNAVKIKRKEIKLTREQEKAYNELCLQYQSNEASVSLLFGITGSGKTLVYLKLIDQVVSDGKSVIVMVPEIALTPQTLSIFDLRYNGSIAVFHSALSMGERLDEWKRVKKGDVSIVIGTRSAIFAPLENIGLIIIDEEQEQTYKSEQSPRYHTKDVAKFRCAKHHALLVLASATPSIETYAAAKGGKYKLSLLQNRYGKALLPEVLTVDMRSEVIKGNTSEISGPLQKALEENLNNNKQSILMINRRGYNTFAACRSCGKVITCPSCSISMRYHNRNKRLMCHYCGFSQPYVDTCSGCGKKDVRYSGFGTQKVEDELCALIPQARVLRMDTDTTMSRLSHEVKFEQFRKMEYDILLGTQMVAKGLDFENVTLVGVISIDQQLYNDDYKSMESAFGLLTQVVGRSGRGRYAGKAIIQTFTPENEIIRFAAKQDYEAFYETEIQIRKLLTYPPFCDICAICFSGVEETLVSKAAKNALEILRNKTNTEYLQEKLIVLGPVPARVLKVSNKYRYRIIIKCHNTRHFRQLISELLVSYSGMNEFRDVTAYIDMNPVSII